LFDSLLNEHSASIRFLPILQTLNTMQFHRIVVLFLSLTNVTLAFTPTSNPNAEQIYRRSSLFSRPSLSLLSTPTEPAAEEGSEKREAVVNNAPTEPGSHEELMYTLGVNLARQLGDIRPLVDSGEELALVAKGLLDTVVGRLSEEGQITLLRARTLDLNNLITDRANKVRERIEAAGKNLLESMANTEGVETFPSGVCFQVLEHGPEGPGAGVQPTVASTIKIHYHGTLPDGTIFDSTRPGAAGGAEAEKPVQLAVSPLIPGWKEALIKMHEGETAMVGIPSDMAYGEEGTPDGRIPGGAAIFFKVQLLEVLTAGVGGGPTLLGADGTKLKKDGGSALLGADGKPL